MSRSRLQVLTYHRVLEPATAPDCDPSLISATPAQFDRQMRHLARRRCVVSAEQLVEWRHDGRPLPPGAVWITFDDGYRDFKEVAWPILRRYGLPATLFVPTAYPDHPERHFWWDRLYRAFTGTRRRELADSPAGHLPLHTPAARLESLRALQSAIKRTPHAEAMRHVDDACRLLGAEEGEGAPVLTWDELRGLAAEGVTVGAHTRTHAALTQLPEEDARAEIRGSRTDLERELGPTTPVFAYPFGDHDEAVAAVAREEGIALAVTCRAGSNVLPGDDPLRLRRTHIGRRTTSAVFAVRLTTAGAALDTWRERRRVAASPPRAPEVPRRSAPRVAYIMSRFPKLSETFVLNEMRAVAALGVAVELYPLLRERQPVAHPEVEAWVRRAHFHPFLSGPVLRANAHFFRRQPARYVGLWWGVLRSTWGSANFFIGALGIFPKAVRFAYEMRRDGVTHVHAHFATHPAVAALIIHRLVGIPFSFTAHGSDLHVERRMLAEKLSAAAFAVTISEFNRRVMVQECGPHLGGKVHVVHCGVDPSFFAPDGAAKPDWPFEVVCVASLELVKGHAYLIEACRLLRERGLDFRCHLVGDGPCRADVERRIAGAGLQQLVVLHGGRPRQEVARLLARSHAAVLASHPTSDGKREGIPVALMEAMAAGLPVVATAISGIPELVETGVTGLLVPSGDPAALADALERLSRRSDLRQRLGDAGRRKVVREFSLEASAAALVDLFSGTARAPRSAGTPANLTAARAV